MAEKIPAWKMVVYYGTAGSAATTLINANVVDVDPGGADFDFVDLPTRGDGATMPQKDELPVCKNSLPKFSMVYHDTDSHMAALLAAAKADPPVGKAIKMLRKLSGAVEFNGDCWLKYSSPGGLKEGQIVEFECHPTSAYGRAWAQS